MQATHTRAVTFQATYRLHEDTVCDDLETTWFQPPMGCQDLVSDDELEQRLRSGLTSMGYRVVRITRTGRALRGFKTVHNIAGYAWFC